MGQEASRVISRVPAGSSGFITPGDIFIFRYYRAPTGNSPGTFGQRAILVVKKRRRASYWGKIKGSLVKILGKDSYRTYKLSEMKQVYKVYYKGLQGSRR